MDDHFLLNGDLAEKLYHTYAESLPVVDYHNHLSVADLKNDRRFENITRLWLTPDPYKHRLMRMAGVPEKEITGDADDYTKFLAFCSAYPRMIGTPVHQWCALELSRVFGETMPVNAENAPRLWETLNAGTAKMTAKTILNGFRCEKTAPCAGITDDLSLFDAAAGVVPSLRADDAVNAAPQTIAALAAITGRKIGNLDEYFDALQKRVNDFALAGCRIADHALDDGFVYYPDDGGNAARFCRMLAGETPDAEAAARLKSAILDFLAKAYRDRGWTMQLHIGALRSTSTRLRTLAGAAGGFAGIGGDVNVSSLTKMLDSWEKADGLPRVILFTLNPAYHAAFSVLAGSYARDGVKGLITEGPAWWWCDHAQGIREMLAVTANFGMLDNFPGMTTDSRSLLSFVRHEYFRRIFCSFIAEAVSHGEMPAEEDLLKDLIEDVCYRNARSLFD